MRILAVFCQQTGLNCLKWFNFKINKLKKNKRLFNRLCHERQVIMFVSLCLGVHIINLDLSYNLSWSFSVTSFSGCNLNGIKSS